jgi:hypothetical protein
MLGRLLRSSLAGAALGVSLAPAACAAPSAASQVRGLAARVQMSSVDRDTGACAVETAGMQREFVTLSRFVLGAGKRTCQQTVLALPAAYEKRGVLAQTTTLDKTAANALKRAPVRFSAHGTRATVAAPVSRSTVTYYLVKAHGAWLVAGTASQSSVSS